MQPAALQSARLHFLRAIANRVRESDHKKNVFATDLIKILRDRCRNQRAFSSAGLLVDPMSEIDKDAPFQSLFPDFFSRILDFSLPRSPTRTITLISAFTFFVIIPSSVLFPTPLPAKIPIRCPFPTVFRPSIAFTPNSSVSVIGGLSSGLIYVLST